MDSWVAAEPHRSWDETLTTLSYFDTMNLAPRIKCPVLFSLGLQDAVCPPASIFGVYNHIQAPKQYRAYHYAGHWTAPSWRSP